MRKLVLSLAAIAGCVMAGFCPGVAAEDATTSASTQPQKIILGDNIATVELPPDFRYVQRDAAVKFLKKQGVSEQGILGIFAPASSSEGTYFVVARFDDCGYVDDKDAAKLNADEILNAYKEGSKEQNEVLKQNHLPPVYIGGWVEKPFYDKALHHVVWGIQIKDEDSATAPVSDINYSTRILGRRGVLSMNLVTAPTNLAANKEKVAQLLHATTFNKGLTYADYVPGKDKAAGYGIAGLILGGGAVAAAAKLGVFGALWKWAFGIILVLKKFIIVAVAGVAAAASKLFGKKKTAVASAPAQPTDTQTPPQ